MWPALSEHTLRPPFTRELDLLTGGELGLVGQVAGSSNMTFVFEIDAGDEARDDGDYEWAVFKPEAGEQYLHDFPPGLWRRERAAFLLSEHLGWHLVPPTVVRDIEGLGIGSLQLYIGNDGSHYFPLYETREDLHDQFRRMAVFDVLTNNTDRKSGHVLLGEGPSGPEHVWGIDQGLCFHQDPKLRTVIWDFAGEFIDSALIEAVSPLIHDVPADIAELLEPAEVEALQERALRLAGLPMFPAPRHQYQFPWPLV